MAAVLPRRLRPGRALALPPHERADAALFRAVNHLPHPANVDQHVTLLSDLGKGAGWVVAGAWLALRDGSRGRRAGLASVAAMFTAIGLVQGPAKVVFRRQRPGRLAIVVGREPLDSSFPSGHTAGSFAAAAALAAFYPRDTPLLLAAAGAVGLSRVYLGHHFPSDVAAGAGIGILLGRWTARALRPQGPASKPGLGSARV